MNIDGCLSINAVAAVNHPCFWDAATKLNFLQEVSDRLESEAADSELVVYAISLSVRISLMDYAEILKHVLQQFLEAEIGLRPSMMCLEKT